MRGGVKKSLKFKPEVVPSILAAIRAGGYPHVAAAAFGITKRVFDAWMNLGEGDRPKAPYKTFALQVRQAEAQARLRAEMGVMDEDPRFWLKNGPGRESEDTKGWAAMVRPILTGPTQNINLFGSPDFLKFLSTMRTILAPHPELLAQLAAALEGATAPTPQLPVLPPIESVSSEN
jgi:hypothetical protein